MTRKSTPNLTEGIQKQRRDWCLQAQTKDDPGSV